MAEQHPVGGGQRQRVAGAFLPGQMLGTRHQLLRLHVGELRKGSVRRLVAPDSLGRREHRVAAVALLVVAVVLVAVDHHLVADLPALHLVAHRPDDARGVRPGDVVFGLVDVEGADRDAQPGPDAVVIDAGRHHQDQHLVAVEFRRVHHLDLERLVRLAVALAADRPGVHLRRHVAHRGHFPDLVEILFRRLVTCNRGVGVERHRCLHLEFMPRRRIGVSPGIGKPA